MRGDEAIAGHRAMIRFAQAERIIISGAYFLAAVFAFSNIFWSDIIFPLRAMVLLSLSIYWILMGVRSWKTNTRELTQAQAQHEELERLVEETRNASDR